MVVIVLLLIAAFLFIIKIILAERFRKQQAGYLEPKLALWYTQHQVKSPQFVKVRQLMHWSNILTSAMWAFIVLAIVLAWLGNKLGWLF